jgi:tRNA A-37 threonylcarbamoyl transferase component Bud32
VAASQASAVSDWERVTALFGAARLLDPDTRQLFLDTACSGDAALRVEVGQLLADSSRQDSFLAESAWAGALPIFMPAASLGPGDLLNERYRVEASVAGGGQAVVYRATDITLSRPVIVKVMRGSGRLNQLLKARFEEEMRALALIDHPGVVGVLDVGELTDGCPFLVIQYINGVSLREELQKGPMAPARAARLLRALGSALSAAHAAGVAHRDVKPENIMVQRFADSSETVKLIDFGISKVDRAGLEEGVTSVTVAGTVRYMAPEQFQGDNSPACDIYALALVGCEMLSGHPDSRALAASLGAEVRRLIDAALVFRAEDRPRDIGRWCDQVAGVLEQRNRPRRRAAAVAAALILASAAAVGAWYVTKGDPEPRRIVEKVGAFDPLAEGFRIHNEIQGTVVENADRTGYDGWQVITSRQGHYFTSLTETEKRRALGSGWKLTARMRVEEGAGFAMVDFTDLGKRFQIDVLRRDDQQLVRLVTQLVPTFAGMDVPWAPADDSYHSYELRYDPGLQTADLWIDGTPRVTGYRGLSQFQGDGDFLFGATVFESHRAVASFQNVRFEINP